MEYILNRKLLKKKLAIFVFLVLCLDTFSQIQTDTFKVLKNNSTVTIDASGFVLSRVYNSVDPFYHASALLHLKTVLNYGKNVKIGARIISEVRNFSQLYEDRTDVFIKPFIYGKLNSFPLLDSVTIYAGDLWRIQNGQGLLLDNFESQGVTFNGYKHKFNFEATLVGVGYTFYDDLYKFSLSYNNLIRANIYIISMNEIMKIYI